jgi:hypothetical protein
MFLTRGGKYVVHFVNRPTDMMYISDRAVETHVGRINRIYGKSISHTITIVNLRTEGIHFLYPKIYLIAIRFTNGLNGLKGKLQSVIRTALLRLVNVSIRISQRIAFPEETNLSGENKFCSI